MTSTQNGSGDIEYPRGDIEIIPPGDYDRSRPFAEGAGPRGYAFRTGSGGVVAVGFAILAAGALFAFLASALVIVASVAVIGLAGYYLRNGVRAWFGR